MASKNFVQLIGNVVADPEVRHSPQGGSFGSLRLATKDRWQDRTTGEWKECTDYHRVVFQGAIAEFAEQYVRKGRLMLIEGKLKTRKWVDKDRKEHYTTEVSVFGFEGFQLLDRKPVSNDVPPQGGDKPEKHTPSESSDSRQPSGPTTFNYDEGDDQMH